MTTGLAKADGLVWEMRSPGVYAASGKRFTIERRGPDWCLIERAKKARLFSTLRDAKAGAEWILSQPKAR